MRIAQEEIFGPVLTVIPYSGERRRRRAHRQRLDLRARRRCGRARHRACVQRRPPDPGRQHAAPRASAARRSPTSVPATARARVGARRMARHRPDRRVRRLQAVAASAASGATTASRTSPRSSRSAGREHLDGAVRPHGQGCGRHRRKPGDRARRRARSRRRRCRRGGRESQARQLRGGGGRGRGDHRPPRARGRLQRGEVGRLRHAGRRGVRAVRALRGAGVERRVVAGLPRSRGRHRGALRQDARAERARAVPSGLVCSARACSRATVVRSST